MPLKNREKPDRRTYVDMPYDARDKDAEMRAATSYVPRKSSRNGATVFNITVFLLVFGVVLLAARAVAGGVGILEISLAFVCALLAVSSVHIALSWERVVVLRMGNFRVWRVLGCISPFPFWSTVPFALTSVPSPRHFMPRKL